MNKLSFFIALLLLIGSTLFAQVGINAGNSNPHPSAGLDVKFNNKGLLPPRMSKVELNAIADPADGLLVYCTDCGSNGLGSLSMYMAGAWYSLNPNCMNPISPSEGINIPGPTQITWNWNLVAHATGYKWNTINDYGSATDMVAATTKTETGLTCNTTYTRYAWAYNNCGNSTPVTLNQTTSACSLSCGSSFTDSRDNKVYTTVLIGTQCWMKQNLNIGTRINGTEEQTDNSTMEKYCYDDLESNCDVYGGLYQWNEMMQFVTSPGVKGICPSGWHVPTDAEWTIATTFLGGESVAGGKMKSTGTFEGGTDLWYPPNLGATNESGFTAFPGGNRLDLDGMFYAMGNYGYWWSSSESGTDYAWNRYLSTYYSAVSRSYDGKFLGFSVRCVRDL